jgi:hypothetical protein
MTDETQGDEWDRIHEGLVDWEVEDKNMEGETICLKNSTYTKS